MCRGIVADKSVTYRSAPQSSLHSRWAADPLLKRHFVANGYGKLAQPLLTPLPRSLGQSVQELVRDRARRDSNSGCGDHALQKG